MNTPAKSPRRYFGCLSFRKWERLAQHSSQTRAGYPSSSILSITESSGKPCGSSVFFIHALMSIARSIARNHSEDDLTERSDLRVPNAKVHPYVACPASRSFEALIFCVAISDIATKTVPKRNGNW